MYQANIQCPKCGGPNLAGTLTCSHCGATMMVFCSNCRAANMPGSHFCQGCGAPLATPDQPAQPQPPAAEQGPVYIYPQGQQPGSADQGYQYGYQQYPGGYPPPYGYQQPAQPAGDVFGRAEGAVAGFATKLKQIASRTNPVLLSALVVLIVGMGVFLILAFQLGWIKSAAAPKPAAAPTSKVPPMMSMLTIGPGSSPNTAIISWVTDKNSSSQVEYGVWPYANTTTLIENDPRTGINTGVLIHKVGLTNLMPRTAYVYRAVSIDKDGNTAKSPDMRFDTSQ